MELTCAHILAHICDLTSRPRIVTISHHYHIVVTFQQLNELKSALQSSPQLLHVERDNKADEVGSKSIA